MNYVGTINRFAGNGFNTTRAAFRVLDYPKFQAFVVQHFLTLGQDYCLIYMLFPGEESFYLNPLIERLGREQDPVAQKSIALALFYTVAPSAQEALKKASNNPGIGPEVKAYVKKLLEQRGAAVLPLPPKTVAQIKAERRKVMSRISDEALIEFDELTQKLVSK